MRPLEELIDTVDPGMVLLQAWQSQGRAGCELLPPAATRGEALYQTQVTTRSLLGTVVYETGGVLIDHGWLRFLGSGSEKLRRSLPEWAARHANGFYLVADDVVGGFFALNQGALGADISSLYYLPPTTLEWECLKIGYTDFLCHAITGDFTSFYEDVRWPGWQADVQRVSGDQAFFFYPPLWTAEGKLRESRRGIIPIEETWLLTQEFIRQLTEQR